LKEAFLVYGKLRSPVVFKTDAHVRHAFVAFEDPAAAQRCVENNDVYVKDEYGQPYKLNVQWANSNGKKRGRKTAKLGDNGQPVKSRFQKVYSE
jgi:hypothetical protein